MKLLIRSMKMKINESDIYGMVRAVLRECLREGFGRFCNPEYNGRMYYHTMINRGQIGDGGSIAKNVYKKGLVPRDNGEANAVWFGRQIHGYNSGLNGIEFGLEYNAENVEKFDLTADEASMFAHSTVPFEDLRLITAPFIDIYGNDGRLRGTIGYARFFDEETHAFIPFGPSKTLADFIAKADKTNIYVVYEDVLKMMRNRRDLEGVKALRLPNVKFDNLFL